MQEFLSPNFGRGGRGREVPGEGVKACIPKKHGCIGIGPKMAFVVLPTGARNPRTGVALVRWFVSG